MNAYETAVSLGITGDVVAQYNTFKQYGLTKNKIAIGDLLFLLSDRDMMVRLIRPADTGEKWSGSLINLILYVNSVGTPEQVTGVNKFFSHITNDRNTWFDTTNPNYSGPLLAMRTLFADQPTMPTSADFDALVGLGGGYVCGTLEEFTNQKEVVEAAAEVAAQVAAEAEALQALHNFRAGFQTRFDAIKNQFGTSEQPLGAAALRAMADEWEAA